MSALQPFRLPSGGLIDRSRMLRFRFDGDEATGFAGDTLASALLAKGTRIVGRSFKYHRPRGILSAGSEEPNALVELRSGARREPNTKATTIELYDGLEARSQNHWPSLKFDVLAVNSLLSTIFVAGFYYKTFMWPSSFWEKLYEPIIRRAAGLGRGAGVGDPDRYEHAYAFCDVLVIGAGPAGLAAALVAARSGARVIVCNEDFCFGGRLLAERQEIGGGPGHVWARRIVDELTSLPDVRLMPRSTVFGVYDGGTYGAIERVADGSAPLSTASKALENRCQACGACDWRHRATDRVRRQRSPRDHVSFSDPQLHQPVRGRTRRPHRHLHQHRRRLADRA